MAPYNYHTYNNFYDPVGSHANQNQPQGYTYSNSSSNPPSSGAQYPDSNQAASSHSGYGSSLYSNQYGNQSYGTAPTQQPSSQAQSPRNSARAANALTVLTPRDHSQSTASNRGTSQYDDAVWNGSGNGSYGNSTAYSQNSRSQASTFGRLSLPDQSQSQTSSTNTFGNSAAASNSSTTSYQTAPSVAASQHRQYTTAYTHQQKTQPPERYASPLHAVQAQQRQSHNRQTSQNPNPQPSPQMVAQNLQQQHQQQQQRRQSVSVEPSPTTVDPSQVYDFRAEQERKARIDAERRKKIDAEKAARKAEEDLLQKIEDDRKAAEIARVAEAKRLEAERAKAEEDAKKAEEEAAKQQQAKEKKNEQRRKAREEKRQSKTAATALQQMALGAGAGSTGSSSNDGQAASMAMMAAMMGDQSQPATNDEEAEMRAMFAKMRDFNAKNPALLAKMWEEERTAHAQSPAQPAPPAAAPQQPPAKKITAQQARSQLRSPAPAQPYQQFSAVNHVNNVGLRAAVPNKAPIQIKPGPTPTPTSTKQTRNNAAIWPPHKKGALAGAAAKWLADQPQNLNTGFTISREQVLKILDSDPSYVQLCEMIEKTGVKFERSALAKELLKAVPDGLRNPSSGKSAASPGMTAQMNEAAGSRKRGPRGPYKAKNTYSVPNQGGGPPSNGTVSYQSPSFSSLTAAALAVNGMSTAPSYPTSSLASALRPQTDGSQFDNNPIIIEDDYQPANDASSAPTEVKTAEPREEPRRPPADKEEAARKRTFADLVDLTGGDDSDDEGPPRKIFQAQRATPASAAASNLNANLGAGLTPLQRAQQLVQQNLGTQHIGKAMQTNQFMRQKGYERPLQFPMQPVVPSQPQQSAKPRGPTQESLQHERMRGKMLVEPIMRDRVARKSKYDVRTIARDVLLATGRHPDMRALNAHLNSMQKLLGDHGGVVDGAGNKSDLSTIKWSVIDPGESAEEAKTKGKAKVDAAKNGDGAAEYSDDESDKEIRTRAVMAPTTNRPDKSSAATNQGFDFPAKKRGRPFGFRPAKKNKAVQSAADVADNATLVTSPTEGTTNNDTLAADASPFERRRRRSDSFPTPVRATPPNKGTAYANMSSSGGAVGYAAFREIDANGNVIKKKGRPVGWRKSLHSKEAQGLTPAKTGAKPPAGNRLRHSTTAPKEVTPQRREYKIYKCEWNGCKSQLDGLDRLRKHVLKVHGGELECKWGGCEEDSTFEDLESWLGHVDSVHLETVGWKLGDGMRGEAYTTRPDAYLSDSHDRSVTPIIVPAAEANFTSPIADLAAATSPSRIKTSISPRPVAQIQPTKVYDRFGIEPLGKSKEEAEAAAELKKLRQQKVDEGALMGRESSALCNAKRRRGFLDDEDFEDIIDDDDDDDDDDVD